MKLLVSLKNAVKKFIAPVSDDEDKRRGEFILHVLLLSSMALFVAAIAISIFAAVSRPIASRENSISVFILIGALGLLCLLYFLSRRGHFLLSARIFISIFFLLSLYMSVKWGVDVNASILLYALSVVMAGVLLGERSAFVLTGLIALSMVGVGYLEKAGSIAVNSYWRTEPWQDSDTIMTAIVFFTVAGVSWLFGREIEKSLARARQSEKLLKEERDALEITVEKRTKELRETQAEKVSQLYRFAEFGRLSSGFFHDLMNPLQAVSLYVEKAKGENGEKENMRKTRQNLEQAFQAAKKMENFIKAVRKQMADKAEEKVFSLRDETKQAIDFLSYKARAAGTEIEFFSAGGFPVFGEEMKWSQVALNLISNAIESGEEAAKAGRSPGKIRVAIKQKGEDIVFSVEDQGIGIPPENIKKIFDPFWSTKTDREMKGIGLGLSLTKNIVEKNFKGEISVVSGGGKTVFSVSLRAGKNQ